ncbi:MAG: pyrroline-5-carboxylate reductase [Gammaproteobacteria bacterium]|nr:pyrroline-5-carboxylate reductase [Gammaproteobacteria bacterium]
MKDKLRIAILGAGNIGTAIANGLAKAGTVGADRITLTRRKINFLDDMKAQGFAVCADNKEAIGKSNVVIVAVEPQQLDELMSEIGPALKAGQHILISVVSGVDLAQLRQKIDAKVECVRAMPNTATAVRESMTCLASDESAGEGITAAKAIFNSVGQTLVIDEELMGAATALGACGVAFFLRAIRAASQGGIEIGFHAEDALAIAAQTAKGAATLLLANEKHPEREIDRVTTPRGCTIAGLNQMEHEGFSSAMIKGITVSAEKASRLLTVGKD